MRQAFPALRLDQAGADRLLRQAIERDFEIA
jgi:hypothetical protein